MDAESKAILWRQLGASIDMLENAVTACPDGLWSDRSKFPEYWYVVFHTLFFLDYYLSDSPEGFRPPAPFTLDELDPRGILPERPYTKEELRAYLEHGRKKCRDLVRGLTEERARERRRFGPAEVTWPEVLIQTMRHVQHHAAQLQLILRQETDSAPRWVFATAAGLGA